MKFVSVRVSLEGSGSTALGSKRRRFSVEATLSCPVCHFKGKVVEEIDAFSDQFASVAETVANKFNRHYVCQNDNCCVVSGISKPGIKSIELHAYGRMQNIRANELRDTDQTAVP